MLDSLIADFKGHPNLPGVLFEIGELYYNESFRRENESFDAKDKGRFIKAAAVWGRIITQLPESEPDTIAQAYCFSGHCYRKLGQYKKAIEYYQKVVDNWPGYKLAWSAQFRIVKMYKWLLEAGVMSESEAEAAITVTFEHLLKKFPDCPAVGVAREWLNYYHNKSSEGGQK